MRDSSQPTAPTIMRMTPTVLRFTPDVVAVTAQVSTAPTAIRMRLTPMPMTPPEPPWGSLPTVDGGGRRYNEDPAAAVAAAGAGFPPRRSSRHLGLRRGAQGFAHSARGARALRRRHLHRGRAGDPLAAGGRRQGGAADRPRLLVHDGDRDRRVLG